MYKIVNFDCCYRRRRTKFLGVEIFRRYICIYNILVIGVALKRGGRGWNKGVLYTYLCVYYRPILGDNGLFNGFMLSYTLRLVFSKCVAFSKYRLVNVWSNYINFFLCLNNSNRLKFSLWLCPNVRLTCTNIYLNTLINYFF